MEISPRRSISLDLNRPVVYPGSSSYPPTYGNYCTSMYAMHEIKSRPDMEIEKTYRMSTLSIDSATKCVRTPKKENFFTSMFGALTSIVVERLSKVPTSFMANVHNTLSVTVVPNEGIISQDFFKKLTRSSDTSHNSDTSQAYSVDTLIPHIITDKMGQFPMSAKTSLNSECNKANDIEYNKNFNEKKLSDLPVISTEIFNELNVAMVTEDSLNDKNSICEKNRETMKDDDDDNDDDGCVKVVASLGNVVINNLIETMIKPEKSSSSSAVTKEQDKLEISNQTCTTGWQTMCHKVVNDMLGHFTGSRTVSPDSEVPTKKPNLSKPPRRKTCTIAHGRRKGRGKSQLRRNGVSQSRHRKDRSKQNIYSIIRDDLDTWEDNEFSGESEDDDSSIIEQQIDQQCPLSLENLDNMTNSSFYHCSRLFENLSFNVSANTKKRRQEVCNSGSNMRVRYVPESSMEIENHDWSYSIDNDISTRFAERTTRLVSESSIDSEDSYCIVFENGSESDNSDYDYDDMSDRASDDDDDLDIDEKEIIPTVRFNLEPQVHTMIKWDYAYRAARRGPWEEMARDRERFNRRIHCIETILNPVLSLQHRNYIWQKRFSGDGNDDDDGDINGGSRCKESKIF